MNFWFIQLIGAIAYILLSISYYKKNQKQILLIQIVADVFFTIHFYLLGGITGALSNIVGLLSYSSIYICDKYNKKKSKNVFAIIMIIILLYITMKTYANIYSVLPFIAFTFTTISFLDGNVKTIRAFGCVACICWLIYAIKYESYVSIVFEGITLIATAYSLIHSKRKIEEKDLKNAQ